MKFTSHFDKMKRLMLLLLFLLGHFTRGDAQETDPLEINLADFLPLEVGNRWTFSHEYINEMYWVSTMEWDEEARAYYRQFEVPGYPIDEAEPPSSLTRPDPAVLTVEITHTEWIHGEEYFVFSGPSYSWPPLPAFFLAGQKVRLSEDGILYFSINLIDFDPPFPIDIPLYDFGMPSREYNYTVSLKDPTYLSWPWTEQIEVSRFMVNRLNHPKFPGHPFYKPRYPLIPDHLNITVNPPYRDKVLEVRFILDTTPVNRYHENDHFEANFVHGYGLGLSKVGDFDPLGNYLLNVLYPVSAVLSGKEVSYEEATAKLVTLVEPDLIPVVGQLDSLFYGFDFSEGTGTDYFDPKSDMVIDQYWDAHADYGRPAFFISTLGIADLGRGDFGRLVSSGTADLEPDPHSTVRRDGIREWTKILQEGHVYAFWTREGGIALTHVIEIVTFPWSSGRVRCILVDWKYFPPLPRPANLGQVYILGSVERLLSVKRQEPFQGSTCMNWSTMARHFH